MNGSRHLTRLLDPNLDRAKYTDAGLVRELRTLIERDAPTPAVIARARKAIHDMQQETKGGVDMD